MRRPLSLALVLALLVAPSLAGCARKVKVQTGTVVTCTYNHLVTRDVKTLEVPLADAARYSVTTETITCPSHRKLEELYAAVQAALGKKDVETAEAKLAEIVKLDAGFGKAALQLKDIKAGKTPAPDTGPTQSKGPAQQPGGGGGKPNEGQEPLGPIANLKDLVPDELAGYKAENLSADDMSLTRAYVPNDKSKHDQLVVMVEQYADSNMVQRRIDTFIKPNYPVGGTSLTVPGPGLKGYFGTTAQFALLAMDNAGLLVVVEMHSVTGKPGDLKGPLQEVAATLLD